MLGLAHFLLIGAAAAAPAFSETSTVPAGSSKAPDGLPMPDIDAIMSASPDSFKSYHTGGLQRGSAYGNDTTSLSKRDGTQDGWKCSDHSSPILTWGDNDDGGRGISITNAGSDWRGFYMYHNTCENVPWKYIWIGPGATQFISFPYLWEGRVVRGVDSSMLNGQAQPLASWLEISWDKNDVGWADLSLIRGYDGSILTWDMGNGNSWKGFTQSIMDGCPGDCYQQKADGQWVIKETENWDGSINTAPRDWFLSQVGESVAYVDDYHGNPVISSSSKRFGSYWPDGRA